jgi:hypothetical protein
MHRPSTRVRSARSRAARFALLSLATVAAGCAPPITACTEPGACGPARVCAAGRCVLPATDPVASDANRVIVAASDMAVVSARGGETLPDEIALAGGCSPVVLLRFPTPWGNRARVVAAFLLLEFEDAASANAEPWALSVTRVLEPWSGADVSWGRLPRLSPPLVRAEVMSFPQVLRIDITEIVSRWSRGRTNDQGIALWASSAGAARPTYATGALRGLGPRLDVYVR